MLGGRLGPCRTGAPAPISTASHLHYKIGCHVGLSSGIRVNIAKQNLSLQTSWQMHQAKKPDSSLRVAMLVMS